MGMRSAAKAARRRKRKADAAGRARTDCPYQERGVDGSLAVCMLRSGHTGEHELSDFLFDQ